MTGKDTAALVRRLRDTARRLVSLGNSDAPICNEAADLTEAQAAEIARLREAGQALYGAMGAWTKPEQGWFTPELLKAGEQWCNVAALKGATND